MQLKKIEEIFSTKWLAMKSATFLNKLGKEGKWEYVSRKAGTRAVTLVCRSKNTHKFLLISQPRVPINKIVIEFPAGLIDEGESIEKAGLRELKEETGYSADNLIVTSFVVKSAGLSDECTAIVEAEVDENLVGRTEMEDTEDIQKFWISVDDFQKKIATLDMNKYIVDTQVMFYFKGHFSERDVKKN